MKIIVDKSADALYIYIEDKSQNVPGIVAKTVIADENVNVDYDKDGKLLGIEILSLNILNLENLKNIEYTEKE